MKIGSLEKVTCLRPEDNGVTFFFFPKQWLQRERQKQSSPSAFRTELPIAAPPSRLRRGEQQKARYRRFPL
ncbi:hypothetical protein [Alteribacillus iranensis]|uniref:hypothetical protein n=1 Tax=Alteribacillus iranensis TaxID=930128 RepID=UPI001160BC65|nr:hypothetical protein [Alteribacillus iranensis]